ncbi:hypothetical protein LI168_03245 [Desulfovibrio desulfuricans]|uniref:TipJ family phage tail tip protein n=1 Tax=Desulfovibrio desulfuricans TaxID=876 RepID=UPI001D06A46F|nr:hypothetical protein [Desulfovibrio desulfuricans]MCB6541152.1 hypothetical protein [Desulfovibrio desulfuricans]MCB6552234.1 hypothetical protein [Desulfovibrio desulfuricans]MCB6564077.1 hypothetical protein [Desulfovibrio desulfuricans]MCB7345257.1 hypothetical protein [Desulfovibrio desulfuricans]MCQ5217290.1 hypothetical protein [Desulfovibrio desulfuricans]
MLMQADLTKTTLMARRWDMSRPTFLPVVDGANLGSIVADAIQGMCKDGSYTPEQALRLMKYARCRVDGVEIKRSLWAQTIPSSGAQIEVMQGVMGGGGGGGGKNPTASILSLVVVAAAAAATWYLGGAGGALVAAGWSVGAATVGAAVAGAAIMMGGMMAINALFPASTPSLSGSSIDGGASTTSQAYSINGARNSANVMGYVPLICGKHRHTPPLAAKNYTAWEGDEQTFYMCVCWGHPDVTVSDFRLDETPLSNYTSFDHRFHQSTTGDDLKYFGKSRDEKSVGTVLKQSAGWVTRTVGEAEDISIDIAFLGGLCSINQQNGSPESRTVEFQAQYRVKDSGSDWTGFYGNNGYISATRAKTTRCVPTWKVEGLPKAIYEMRIKRLTADTDSQFIRDEATWSVTRAIINQPVFNTPVPICVSELRIKASEQISSYVDDFNALCQSNIPDWNGSAWVTKPTSNPASIMRYLLTTRHGLVNPYTEAKLDNATLVELWEWCNERGYEFNFICDSEETLWSRLVQVLAPGLAAPTTDVDCLWGAVIDRPNKEVVQLFTPRNSWGMNVQRTFSDLPHALRVTFKNEDEDYKDDEQFIYAPGYSKDGSNGTEKAWNIVEWSYPGITKWAKLWAMGQVHLARMLHRPLTVTLNTDFEWMVASRGKLVGVAHDVLMNTFGTARINYLVYDVDGVTVYAGKAEDIPLDEEGNALVPIGVQLDDTIIFSEPSPARYGIAVRYNNGSVNTYELIPNYGDEEHSTLLFKYAITAAQVPPFRALCSVSLFGSEYEEYLLSKVDNGDNNSAQLTLVPYAADAIDKAATGEATPYDPAVVLDVVKSKRLPTPTIVDVRSDETVLISASSGGTTPRIAAWWSFGASTGDTSTLTMQISATDVETNAAFFGTATMNEDYVACAGVTEGRLYSVRVRAIDGSTGKTSPWSTPIKHVCIGRTTLPPAPSSVYLAGTVLKISQADRPLDLVGHVVKMVFDDTDPISYALTLTDPYATTGQFDIGPWSGHARRVFVQAIDELGNLSEAVSVALNLGDVETDNVLFTISEASKGWTGTVVNGSIDGATLKADETAYLWPQDDNAPLWTQDDSFPLWPSGGGLQMQYAWSINIPAAYAGARILINPVATAGRLAKIEFRVYTHPPLWPQDDNAFLWPQNDSDYLWPQPMRSEWKAFPDTYITTGAETLAFRVTYAAGTAAILTDIETIIDVPDKEHVLDDLEITADGTTHIPVPADTFRAVTNVVATLQYRSGDTAVMTAKVPGSEIVGSNGYLTNGPLILALNSSRNGVSAVADVRIRGY